VTHESDRAAQARGSSGARRRYMIRIARGAIPERGWPQAMKDSCAKAMNNFSRITAAAALALFFGPPAHAESGWGLLNMPQGVTALSRRIYDLHMMMLWVCVAIGVVVFGVMIYSIVTFRHSRGAVPDTTMVHNTKVEVIWTVIPVAILIAVAIPAARTLVQTEDLRNTQLTIKVTGFQWGWNYDYLASGIDYFSRLDRASDAARQLDSGIDPRSVPHYLLNVDHPLVVPVDTKVRLLLTADDVIHSWWVPDLGVKKDAIPGYVNEAWFKIDADKPGVYRGQCAELCGRDHAFMPIVVEALSKKDFQAWVKAQQSADKAHGAPNADTPLAAVPAAAAPAAQSPSPAAVTAPAG
jgi:cytochrome c oxidase subunit 2